MSTTCVARCATALASRPEATIDSDKTGEIINSQRQSLFEWKQRVRKVGHTLAAKSVSPNILIGAE